MSAAEEDLSPMEAIQVRHRKEKKELQARIQSLKKTSSKGDKKKRKEVQEEIATLEKDLESRHAKELAEVKTEEPTTNTPQEAAPPGQPTQRISKAQKRRNEKEKKEKDREAEIELAAEMNKFGVRQLEIDKLESILKERGLQLKEMPGDGDCMFSSIADQVPGQCVKGLRSAAAKRLRETMGDVLPFMTNKEGNPMMTEEFETYCSHLESRPDMWGGQIELNALAHVLKVKIEVIQSEGASVILGEDHEKCIILIYHRHILGLGEHYNSVTKIT